MRWIFIDLHGNRKIDQMNLVQGKFDDATTLSFSAALCIIVLIMIFEASLHLCLQCLHIGV